MHRTCVPFALCSREADMVSAPDFAASNGTGRPNRPPPDSPVSLTGASPRHGPRRSTSDAARAAAAAAAGTAGMHLIYEIDYLS